MSKSLGRKQRSRGGRKTKGHGSKKHRPGRNSGTMAAVMRDLKGRRQ